ESPIKRTVRVKAALHARRREPDYALHWRAGHSGGARYARPAGRHGGGLQCHDRRTDRGLSTIRQWLCHFQPALPLCRHSLGYGEPFAIDRHHARAHGWRPVSVPRQHRRAGGTRAARPVRDRLAAGEFAAADRMKLFKLAWDLVGSDHASRATSYEKFFVGPAFAVRNYNFINAPWDELHAAVEGFMDTYGTGESAADAEPMRRQRRN